MTRLTFGLVLLLSSSIAWSADLQSLADVARREADRRASQPKAGRVYTNGDLTPDITTSFPTESAPRKAQPEGAASTKEDEIAPDGVRDSDSDVRERHEALEPLELDDKGEDYWRARANSIRERVNHQRAQVAALQGRVTSLADAQGVAGDRERELTSKALLKAQSDLAYLEKDLVDFEVTARRKNVPLAWIQ